MHMGKCVRMDISEQEALSMKVGALAYVGVCRIVLWGAICLCGVDKMVVTIAGICVGR